jgi:hypothetical protein
MIVTSNEMEKNGRKWWPNYIILEVLKETMKSLSG